MMKYGRRLALGSIAASLALLCFGSAALAGEETQNVGTPEWDADMSGTITWIGTKDFKYGLELSSRDFESNRMYHVQFQALHADITPDSGWTRLTDDWKPVKPDFSDRPKDEVPSLDELAQAQGAVIPARKQFNGYHNGPGLATGYTGVRFRVCGSGPNAGCGDSSPDYLRPNYVGK